MRCINTDGVRAHEESVGVEFGTCLIAIVVKADLGVVAWEYEVVPVVVCNESILVAIVEGIQEAVGIFFGLIEPDDVVLILVAQSIPKNTHSSVGVREDESSEIAGEELRSCTHRNEVVVRASIRDFRFIKPLFERPKGPVAIRPIGYIGRHDSQFVHLEVVLIEDDIGFETPIKGTKDRVSFEQVDRSGIVLGEKELIGVSEKFKFPRMLSRFGGCCWDRCLTVLSQIERFESKF